MSKKPSNKDVIIEQLKTQVKRLGAELAEAHMKLQQQAELLTSFSRNTYKELERATERLSVSDKLSTSTKCRELQELQESKGHSECIRTLSVRLSRKESQLSLQKGRDNQSEHCNLTAAQRDLLVKRLDASRVASEMYQNAALTLRELELIQECAGGPSKSAETLFDILQRLPYEGYQCFLAALKSTEQEDIYVDLKYTDYRPSAQHTAIIQHDYIYLIDTIDSKYNPDLLNILLSEGVLDLRDKEYIACESNQFRQNERLLSILSRKTVDKFLQFIDALVKSEQQHIAIHISECELFRQLVASHPQCVPSAVVMKRSESTPAITDDSRTAGLADAGRLSVSGQSINCVLVGDHDSDKSRLLTAVSLLSPETYHCNYMRAFNITQCRVSVNNKSHSVTTFGTTGQEEFPDLRVINYTMADVFLVCFSITSPSSLHSVQSMWVPEVSRCRPTTPLILVGTWTDLRQDGETSSSSSQHIDGRKLAIELKAVKYIECCLSKTDAIELLLQETVKAALSVKTTSPSKKQHSNLLEKLFHRKSSAL